MNLKALGYNAAKAVWLVVVIGPLFVTYTGVAEPYLSRSMLPLSPVYWLAGGAVILAVGWLAISSLETMSWRSAGRAAGLTPQGWGGVFGKPDLVGKIRGRQVRARTIQRREGGGRGNSKNTYTVVEAELDGPAESGLVVTAGEEVAESSMQGHLQDQSVDIHRKGEFGVLGGSEDVADALLSRRSRDAIRDLDASEAVYVGNAVEAWPSLGGGMVGSMFQNAMAEALPSDESTVATDKKGLVLDGDELQRRAETVAAVADAYENASGSDRWGQ